MTSLDLHDTAGANSDAVINSADPAVYPSTLTFGAKVPHSSFAGYSSELPGFSVTLKADMSGSITENYMEEVNRFDIRWSYSDTMLIMTHGGDRYTVTFSGGNGIYDSCMILRSEKETIYSCSTTGHGPYQWKHMTGTGPCCIQAGQITMPRPTHIGNCFCRARIFTI